MDWARDNSINVFESGMLVHPTLGISSSLSCSQSQPPITADPEKALRTLVAIEMIDLSRPSLDLNFISFPVFP